LARGAKNCCFVSPGASPSRLLPHSVFKRVFAAIRKGGRSAGPGGDRELAAPRPSALRRFNSGPPRVIGGLYRWLARPRSHSTARNKSARLPTAAPLCSTPAFHHAPADLRPSQHWQPARAEPRAPRENHPRLFRAARNKRRLCINRTSSSCSAGPRFRLAPSGPAKSELTDRSKNLWTKPVLATARHVWAQRPSPLRTNAAQSAGSLRVAPAFAAAICPPSGNFSGFSSIERRFASAIWRAVTSPGLFSTVNWA
jgi:hypothetical protein